jgi:hypothetical protein
MFGIVQVQGLHVKETRYLSPWHFITVPDEECGELEVISAFVTYGWGMIPVTAQIGRTGWKTSLSRKMGGTSCR